MLSYEEIQFKNFILKKSEILAFNGNIFSAKKINVFLLCEYGCIRSPSASQFLTEELGITTKFLMGGIRTVKNTQENKNSLVDLINSVPYLGILLWMNERSSYENEIKLFPNAHLFEIEHQLYKDFLLKK